MENNLSFESIPVLAMRGIVIFPDMTLNFDVGREKSLKALKAALNGNRKILLIAQKDASVEDPDFSDLRKIGVVAEIKQFIKLPHSENFRVIVEGKYRASVTETVKLRPYLHCIAERKFDEPIEKNDEILAHGYLRALQESFDEYADVAPRMSPDVGLNILVIDDLPTLVDFISGVIFLEFKDKCELLDELSPLKRAEKLCNLLIKETEILKTELDIREKVQESVDKNQREYYLREEIKAISKELNEDDSPVAEAEEFKSKIKTLPIDDKSKKKLFDECDRYMKMAQGSPEATVSYSYIQRVLGLPWNKVSKESLDIKKARNILNKEHYGLNEVKERILELIAVRKLSENVNSQIICLVGPPGVGKTSIAKSLAKAMNREYARISLGGVHDEAEIRGHRRTYIGSMPGRIISALEQAGTKNPLILLDEIDKLGGDYKGDPSSALLEVLDGEQNFSFCDHYIDIPFDLSKVLFITTANDASAIPAPLYDRMDIIELYSYTAEEKFNIVKKHILPKQMKKFNITSKMLKISDDAVRLIIDGYTKEAGVRTAERQVAKILRKCSLKFAEGQDGKITVKADNLEEYLGAVRYKGNDLDFDDMTGVANGLAWTSVGGEMMQIEVAVLPGSGKLELTGSLGDVMKESAKAAVSYIRSTAEELKIDADFYKDKDIHIHVPEGAVPKDGPSAGVTITTALVSALSGIPVKNSVAMTGEITLRGRVLPIGGLREKSMAAYKNGITTVLIPCGNKADLEEIDGVVKEKIKFIPVSSLCEALALALNNENTAEDVFSAETKNIFGAEVTNKSVPVYSRGNL